VSGCSLLDNIGMLGRHLDDVHDVRLQAGAHFVLGPEGHEAAGERGGGRVTHGTACRASSRQAETCRGWGLTREEEEGEDAGVEGEKYKKCRGTSQGPARVQRRLPRAAAACSRLHVALS
jgi:hypothetical protein